MIVRLVQLVTLSPEWELRGTRIVGIAFRCPCHPEEEHPLRVFFANPPDGGAPHGGHTHYWAIIGGTSFADLSLNPSIDARPLHVHFNLVNGVLQIEE